MIRFARDFRLIPIVLVAIVSLFALKSFGLLTGGGYTLGERLAKRGNKDVLTISTTPPQIADAPETDTADPSPVASAAKPWAAEMFNYPDVTGSVGDNKTAAEVLLKVTEKPPAVPDAKLGDGTPIPLGQGKINSAGERAILERLTDRRQELDARGRELEMRESLLKAAEKRLEARVTELKEVETRINVAMNKRDEAEATRFKNLVMMYENMKAKEAARIFDRLEMKILIEVATQINPRRMSDILSQMTPEAAEKLTVELANRARGASDKANPANLPKIEGRPTGG
jgi:flagellar motility protein MotE (MotC chaperone)